VGQVAAAEVGAGRPAGPLGASGPQVGEVRAAGGPAALDDALRDVEQDGVKGLLGSHGNQSPTTLPNRHASTGGDADARTWM
jgi:hypothetical protein